MSDGASQKTAITLCGSLRKGSINEILRRHMSAKLREAGVAVTDLDLKDFEMPVFNQDLEAEHTPEAAKRLERVLWNDPATGVMRHADAGYDVARDWARTQQLNLPMVSHA